MMKQNPIQLQLKSLWLGVGFMLMGIVVYESISIDTIEVDIAYFDKFAHVLAYFLLMGWFVQIYQSTRAKVILALLFIGMGVAIEYIQGAGGVRYFELADMLANMGGVMCAWLLSYSPFSRLLFEMEKRLLLK